MTLPNRLNGFWLNLIYTTHSLERLKERSRGSLIVKPINIKLTKNNVINYIKKEEKVVVKIPYTSRINMFLICKLSGVVKTLYFENIRNNKQTIST